MLIQGSAPGIDQAPVVDEAPLRLKQAELVEEKSRRLEVDRQVERLKVMAAAVVMSPPSTDSVVPIDRILKC